MDVTTVTLELDTVDATPGTAVRVRVGLVVGLRVGLVVCKALELDTEDATLGMAVRVRVGVTIELGLVVGKAVGTARSNARIRLFLASPT